MKINAKENLMKGGLFNMLERQKEIVVEVGKYLFERGFTQLSGGNISVRDPQTNLVAIKPSGVAYGVMKPEDIIICLLYTSPSPRDMRRSRMPSSA